MAFLTLACSLFCCFCVVVKTLVSCALGFPGPVSNSMDLSFTLSQLNRCCRDLLSSQLLLLSVGSHYRVTVLELQGNSAASAPAVMQAGASLGGRGQSASSYAGWALATAELGAPISAAERTCPHLPHLSSPARGCRWAWDFYLPPRWLPSSSSTGPENLWLLGVWPHPLAFWGPLPLL